ncbi:diacylglycerol kinase family lipid kinase [soil metagenome]
MADDAGETLVIGNPRAGRGRVVRSWDELLRHMHEAGLKPDGKLTEHPGHATELARKARSEGLELVVAVGGDGTVHEVVNGLLADGLARNGEVLPALGLLPAGSGCDYARTFAVPPDLVAAVTHLTTVEDRFVDVGEVRYQSEDGERVRFFVNVAEVGIGADVAERASRLPRILGPGRYALAFFLTLAGQRTVGAEVEVDGQRCEGPLTNLVVALGQYYGGGMKVAPRADPSDGRFEVQIQSGSKLDYALAMPKVFRGTHLPHPRVREERAGVVEVRCTPEAKLEADGEVLGTTPAIFRIVPGALRVRA